MTMACRTAQKSAMALIQLIRDLDNDNDGDGISNIGEWLIGSGPDDPIAILHLCRCPTRQ